MNYKNSGVDIDKGKSFIGIIKDITKNNNIGGFSGIYDYNGIKLRIGPGGYDFNKLNFHRHSEDPNNAVLNPRIELIYSR